MNWLTRWWRYEVLKRDEWKPCGYSLRTPAHYDQDKAVESRLKALKLAKLARKVADRRSQQDQSADVVPMRRAK